MTKATAAELLQLLIEQAPKLREAGVAKVDLECISFELLPLEPAPTPSKATDDDDEDEKPRDALYDKDTFGGRRIPGNSRRERAE